jgi:hypothetical protein
MKRSMQLTAFLIVVCTLATSRLAGAQNAAARPAPAPTDPVSTVPRSVPFTGQVVTAVGEARTGTVLVTFGLYTDQTGGAPIWTEQQLVTLDRDGRYAAILGAASKEGLPAEAFAAGTPKWLGIQIEGEAEQPRFMLLSVPYALKAADADTIAGKPVTEFVTAAHLTESVKSAVKESTTDRSTNPSAPLVTPNALVKYANSGGTLTESSTVDVGGKLGIAVGTPLTELDVQGFGSSTTLTLRNGGSAADVVKLVGSDGSLRIGSATTANLINLIGPNVGIGTTTPSAALHTSGANAASTTFVLENTSGQTSRQLFLSAYGSAGAGEYWPGLNSPNTSSLWGPNLFVLRATNGLVFSGSASAEHMRVSSDGHVGINTGGLTSPYRFAVLGGSVDGAFVRTDRTNGVAIAAISESGAGTGVVGQAGGPDAIGVHGYVNFGTGVRGETQFSGNTVGVEAINHATSGFGDGMRATTSSPDAVGIWARNLATDGTAGRFDGNVAVNGTIIQASAAVKIDHPLDPENQYLYHSAVESPDMMNIYDGIVTTDASGEAEVTLPEWFEALNGDFRYQLTCIGTFAQAIVAKEINGNRFQIKTSIPGVKVSWQVTGIRQDAWARRHRAPVEETKPALERGRYLHPEVFDQPAERAVGRPLQ